MDGDGDNRFFSSHKERTATITLKSGQFVVEGKSVKVMSLGLPKERLHGCLVAAESPGVTCQSDLLLLLDVLEAQLDVGPPRHLAVELEQGVIILEFLLGLAGPVLFREANINDLIGGGVNQFPRHPRIEDKVFVATLIAPRVDIVCYCEHEVAGDEEACARERLLVAVLPIDDSHAVIGELFRFLLIEGLEFVPEAELVLKLYLIPIHF